MVDVGGWDSLDGLTASFFFFFTGTALMAWGVLHQVQRLSGWPGVGFSGRWDVVFGGAKKQDGVFGSQGWGAY